VYTGKVKLASQCYASAVILREKVRHSRCHSPPCVGFTAPHPLFAQALGVQHSSTITAKANLACVLLLGGQVADGASLLATCVAELKSALGTHNPRTQVMQSNLDKARRHTALLSQDYGGLGRRPLGLGLRSTAQVSHLLTDAQWKGDLRQPAEDPFKRAKPKGRRGKK
jgi:hypothetical protein